MTDTVARFGGSKTITGDDVGELGEELLNLWRSGEERRTKEGRLSGRRGVEDDRLWTLGMDHLASHDVDEEVEVFQEISSKEGD